MTEPITNVPDDAPAWVKDPSQFDPARAWHTIQHLQSRVADLDKQRGELENKLGEQGNVEQELADAQAKLAAKTIKEQNLRIRLDARNRGIPDDAADGIVDHIDRDLWRVDSNAAFAALKESKPYLFMVSAQPQQRGWLGWLKG